MVNKHDDSAYSDSETKARFAAILRGAMHKPTPHKDVPHKRKKKAAKPSSSGSSRAT
jgi:hypothetical protein